MCDDHKAQPVPWLVPEKVFATRAERLLHAFSQLEETLLGAVPRRVVIVLLMGRRKAPKLHVMIEGYQLASVTALAQRQEVHVRAEPADPGAPTKPDADCPALTWNI